MVNEKPEFKDAKEYLCQDSEICSAKFEKIGDILDMLKNCDPEFNRFENRKRPPREYTDAELFDFQDTTRTHKIKYTDEELLNTRDVAGITRKKHHKKSSSKKYPKCVPASKAARMTAAQRKSAISRKRKAGNPGGKPTMVKTFTKSRRRMKRGGKKR